jgi:hypothetical protein
MSHRMTLDNGRTGKRYTLILEAEQEQWQACWYESFSEDKPGQHPAGSVVSGDAYDAFVKAKRLIEDKDEDVMGVDWQFEAPLPPWFFE